MIGVVARRAILLSSGFFMMAAAAACAVSSSQETTGETAGAVRETRGQTSDSGIPPCSYSPQQQGFKNFVCVASGANLGEASKNCDEKFAADGIDPVGDTLVGCTGNSSCGPGQTACWYNTAAPAKSTERAEVTEEK